MVKKTHILIYTQYFYPEQFRINDIAVDLIERGYQVSVVTGIPNYPEGDFYDGYGLSQKRREEWKDFDFSPYDTVIHLAGIAHIKETKENEHLYYEVNRDLAIAVAEKAKQSEVKHFIFMSTMSVYGLVEGHIDKKTPINPTNAYGKSKLQAEEEIKTLNNNGFIVSIIRPPMIYGPGSKGNYALLSNFAKKTKIFPSLDNKRSMLFIDNLSIFLIHLINTPTSGIYFPQNEEYVSTKEMVSEIAKIHNNKIIFTNILDPILSSININLFKKVFGSLTYDTSLSGISEIKQKYNFKDSIRISEGD